MKKKKEPRKILQSQVSPHCTIRGRLDRRGHHFYWRINDLNDMAEELLLILKAHPEIEKFSAPRDERLGWHAGTSLQYLPEKMKELSERLRQYYKNIYRTLDEEGIILRKHSVK